MLQQKFDELRLTGGLPSPSAVGLRVLEITQQEDYNQEDLVRTVMADPALSGRIIKLANSAAYAGDVSADSVAEAAMRLGAARIRTLALGFTLIDDEQRADCLFNFERFWARSLASAVTASVIAFELRRHDAGEAFTCALLARIGQLSLASVHPAHYSCLLDGNEQVGDADLARLETRTFGINHAEVSALMMSDWGLPESFQLAVLRHAGVGAMSSDVQEQVQTLAIILSAAEALADVLVLDPEKEQRAWLRALFSLEEHAQLLGISPQQLHILGDTARTAWSDWCRVIGCSANPNVSVVGSMEYVQRVGLVHPGPEPVQDPAADNPDDDLMVDTREETTTEPEAEPRPCRILLIDDDARMLRLISHHLTRGGYEVILAESSEEGLKKAVSVAPQLVITDWMLPGMSGIELCRTLRKTEAGAKLYVLMVTAREDDEQVVEAFAAGADDYIVKPFNPRILMARVRAGERMIQLRERVEDSERAQQKQVAELGILARKLRSAALTDTLTQLPNRRYVMKRLKQEWDSSLRTGRNLSVAVADIDFFKKVNDQFGHDAGDAVLRSVADTMRIAGRSTDVLARLGGEEFLMIHIGGDATMAAASAERLREAVESATIEHEGLSISVTLSLGVAQRGPGMRSVDDLFKAADEALYAAKASGRNCIFAVDPLSGSEPLRRSA